MPTLSPKDLMERVRTNAERSGAAEAETYMEIIRFTEVRVRQREVELVQQSSIQGLGLRVFRDRRMGFMYTTDLRAPVLDEIVNRTIALAAQASPRDENKLTEEVLSTLPDLEIYDGSIPALRAQDLTDLARSAEQNAFARDRRIETTNDARCGVQTLEVHFTNTFLPYQTFQTTSCWLSVSAVATQGAQKREGEYGDRQRWMSDLQTAEHVGRRAADRALAKLGAAPIPSTKAPVLFDAESASGFLRRLFPALSGRNVADQRSFLAGKLGKPIASPLVSIVDDGIRRRGLGSRPFDGEGVQSRRTVAVDRGVLDRYLQNTESARRLGVGSTGNAGRSYDTIPTVAPTNFYIEAGSQSPDRIVAGLAKGLLVTDLAGFGIDTVSGEFSQQVEGQWIEGGKIVRPVEGITIGGNLADMLLGIDAVGNDLEFRDAVRSPSLLFHELTIGGV
ncbi:MAG: TldD/PmbA family protein [Hyphomicrobiales bacterium]